MKCIAQWPHIKRRAIQDQQSSLEIVILLERFVRFRSQKNSPREFNIQLTKREYSLTIKILLLSTVRSRAFATCRTLNLTSRLDACAMH